MKQLLWRFLYSSALTVFVLANGVLVAHANHPWASYHWAHTGIPFTLPVGDNTTTSDWQTTLDSVINDWATGAGSAVSATGQSTTAFTPLVVTPVKATGVAGSRCKAVTGTSQVCNNRYGANGWLGLATIWLSGGHITQGTAKMNDTYLSASGGRYNTVNERRHVMCQETAHTFGLGHQSTNGDSLYTCMDYSPTPEPTKIKRRARYRTTMIMSSSLIFTRATPTPLPPFRVRARPAGHQTPGTWTIQRSGDAC
jgi:hypothetical protein